MSTEYPMTKHDTLSTILSFRHLTEQLQRDLHTEVFEAKDHDSLRDGNPVASVVVEYTFEVYPVDGTETVGIAQREQSIRRWAIDVLVDDSDPSVGMFGSEPTEHSLHDNFGSMLVELSKLVIQRRVEDALEYEAEALQAVQQEQADQQAEAYWASQGA